MNSSKRRSYFVCFHYHNEDLGQAIEILVQVLRMTQSSCLKMSKTSHYLSFLAVMGSNQLLVPELTRFMVSVGYSKGPRASLRPFALLHF